MSAAASAPATVTTVAIVAAPPDWVAISSFVLAVAAFGATAFLTLRGWRKATETSVQLQRAQLRLEMERQVYLDTAGALDTLYLALAGAQAYGRVAYDKFSSGQDEALDCVEPAKSALLRLIGEPGEALAGSEALVIWRSAVSDYALIRPELSPLRDQLWEQVVPLVNLISSAVLLLEDLPAGKATGKQVADALEPLVASLENWRLAISHFDTSLRDLYVANVWEREWAPSDPEREGPRVIVTPAGWQFDRQLTVT